MRIALVVSVLVGWGAASIVSADDWPQWLGPNRDSVWRETGIVERFPEQGLPVKWRTPIELGYSGPAVAEGRVIVMDYVRREGEVRNNPGGRDRLEGTERVLCFAADSGKLLWKYAYDRPYHVSFGGGPRCTPTLADGKVYALGAEGNLTCLDARTGQKLWEKDYVEDYGAETPMWGVAAHPLVDGDTLYCVVGGQGSVAVALDKDTGRERWRALSASQPGYCPPTIIEHGGRRQLLIWHAESINSLAPATGRVYWSIPLKPAYGMAIAAPRKLGNLLFASAYGNAAALLKLSDTEPAAEIVWRGKPKTAVYSGNVTPILEQGMIYGCDIATSALVGVRIDDGSRLWQTLEPTLGQGQRGRYGTASLVKHADRFLLFNEKGDLILARLSPAGYQEIDRAQVIEPTNTVFGRRLVWSHPAFAQKCLFARNDRELVCVNLAAGK